MPGEALVVGVDIGTSGVRIAALDADRDVVATVARSIAEDPRSPRVWWAAVEACFAELSAAIDKNPKNAEVYLKRGLVYLEKKDHESALSDVNKAIEINSKYADALIVRGKIYVETRDAKNAFQDLDKAAKIDPKIAEIYNLYGRSYSLLANYPKALENKGSPGTDID